MEKAFIHLIRILECVNGATYQLNRRSVSLVILKFIFKFCARFRDMPTFGRDSIRRFSSTVSELRKLGARDYENLLQVFISLFLQTFY